MEWRLLSGVPENDVRKLLAIARRRTFRRGEVVFHRDDPADSLHLIARGRFAVRVMTPLGDQVTIAIRGPGESFGEMALIDGGARSATIEALQAGETFSVYQTEFERLRRDHPSVTEIVIAFLANEVRMLDERLLEALYVPVERRVLRRVHELARLYGPGPDGTAEIPLIQEEIAELAGTSRATVNAVLRDAQENGLVRLTRAHIHVLEPDSLARHARRP